MFYDFIIVAEAFAFLSITSSQLAGRSCSEDIILLEELAYKLFELFFSTGLIGEIELRLNYFIVLILMSGVLRS